MTTSYCTPGDLADFTGASYSGRMIGNAELACEAASRTIDEMCRQFFYDTGTVLVPVTTRTFRVKSCDRAYVDPFHTTTGLIIKTDSNDDGLYATTWTATDYELGRFNDRPDAPYDTIFGSLGSYSFPTWSRRRDTLEVTARWGWATVPTPIKRACLVLAGEMMKDPDTPFGVAGFDNFGAVRVRANPRVEQALAPYIRYDRVGIG